VRRDLDFYETAAWQVDALVDHLPELSGSIWCPCVGDGSLMRRLKERRPDLGPFVTNDIDPAREADMHYDATNVLHWHWMRERFGRPDWVVDNPPFNVEAAIAARAFEVACKGVVLMSRISFPEGTRDRGPWLAEHPRAKQITLERYSFSGNGKSDSTTTEWLVWAKVPILNPGGYTAYGYKSGEVQRQYVDLEASA
jgi:hypothetical protein